MNTKTKSNSFKKFAAAGILICLLLTGWILHTLRPAPAVFIIPSGAGRQLIAVKGGVCIASPGNISEMPALSLMLARMRPTRLSWKTLDAPGAKPRNVRGISLDGPESGPRPVWDGKDGIFYAQAGGKLTLFSLEGKKIAEHIFPGGDIRDLAVSRDGTQVAVSVISQNKSLFKGPFKLLIIDASLTNISEINISGIYPMLSPGAIEWGLGGALYFSGFDRDDHTMRRTYRADPLTGGAEPMVSDWGPMFAISPDGAMAASVQWRGLVLTNTTSGAEKVFATPGLRPVSSVAAWAPDGARVAFMLNARPPSRAGKHESAPPQNPRVMIADISGAAFSVTGKPLPDFNCGVCRPVWTPDGSHVLFNGYSFESRVSAVTVRRDKVLAADARSGEVSYPDNPESLWK